MGGIAFGTLALIVTTLLSKAALQAVIAIATLWGAGELWQHAAAPALGIPQEGLYQVATETVDSVTSAALTVMGKEPPANQPRILREEHHPDGTVWLVGRFNGKTTYVGRVYNQVEPNGAVWQIRQWFLPTESFERLGLVESPHGASNGAH